MTLRQFLEALTNKNVKVTLMKDGDTLISFDNIGYASVESDILDHAVLKWAVDGSTSITVTIKEVDAP